MKKIIIILFLFTTIALFAQNATDLFVSEYVEGSSFNKAIEIFNGTGAPVDLSSYSLKIQRNGNGDFGNELNLEGTIPDNDVFVIVYDHGGDGDLTGNDFVDMATTSQAMSFNGNDAVALCKNGEAIDVIGVVGSSDYWGKNKTLVRNSYVASPTPTYIETDWTEYPQDTFDYLGYHDFQGGMDQYLIITSPNGGEEWEQGSTHTITWTSLNYDGNIKLELITSQNLRDVLVESTENDGEWEWTIPQDQTVADNYLIKITSVDSLELEDTSDDTFSIIEPIPYTEYSIYDIQYSEEGPSPHEGERIITSGVVTAIFYNSYYIQDGVGAWTGVCVYDTNEDISLGNKIQFKAIVQEYNGKTELTDIEDLQILGQYPIPEATLLTTAELSTSEAYEGVLVRLENVTVTNDSLGYGEWEIQDNSGTPCRVDDLGGYDYEPQNDDHIYGIEGIVDFSYGNYKLEPRTDTDIDLNGLEIRPKSLVFDTYEQTNGLEFTVYNLSDTTITITQMPFDGDFQDGVAVWQVETSLELPYEIAPNSFMSFNVTVGLPVQNRTQYLISQIPIETTAGNFEVKLFLNDELPNTSENDMLETSKNSLNIYPNPFFISSKSNLTISYNISSDGITSLSIYNMKGQLVKKLSKQYLNKGTHSINWNLKNSNNKNVSSGIYLIKMQNNKEAVTKKFIYLK